MAEGSGLWDGSVTGDAAGSVWAAPYSYFDYAEVFSLAFLSEDGFVKVIPGYLNELNTASLISDSMSVSIDTGAAFVRGQLYINDELLTVTIDAADATNPRIDRIVLQIVYANQTIRIAIVKGTPAAAPTLPTLTQNNTTYEVEIARVYVKAAVLEIDNVYVEDRRIFLSSSYSHNNYNNQNLLTNHELLVPPAKDGSGWGVNSATVSASFPSALVTRGNIINSIGGSGVMNIFQTVPCKPDTLYTLKFLYKTFAGTTYHPYVKINTDTDSTGVTKYFPRVSGSLSGNWETMTVRHRTDSNCTTLTVTYGGTVLTGGAGGGSLSQTLLCEGYWTGPFREVSEIIPLKQTTGQLGGPTAAPGSPTALNLSTLFSTIVSTGVRAVELDMRIKGLSTVAPTAGSLGVRPRNVSSGNCIYTVYGTSLTSTETPVVGFCAVDGTTLYIVPTGLTANTQYNSFLVGVIT